MDKNRVLELDKSAEYSELMDRNGFAQSHYSRQHFEDWMDTPSAEIYQGTGNSYWQCWQASRAATIKEIQDEWKASLSMQGFEDKLMGLK